MIAAMSLDELKLVYQALHKSLPRFPELMDTDFLLELQDYLQSEAGEEGVDATHHEQWDNWLSRPSPSRTGTP